ncbi:hypothetical protein [Chitinophaga japonensis]|uniref:Uncharacterized protein n=1 Tax=Chitinophaga japonensis TaxID=104662 RepID=A0A562T2D2_CHIJA|nr:hypothetical protein [Chitinophaga japonensis]TWI87821.1 hypothetical protein LX66_1892 [Chitinophaga japonensis]
MTEKTKNGIQYTWEIVSENGAGFILFPEPHHTREDIDAALSELRHDRDVVRLRVATVDDWDERYRKEIFSHPLVGKLRWFEINDDPRIINHERRKGTSAEDYVNRFVLPFKECVKAINTACYGKDIVH